MFSLYELDVAFSHFLQDLCNLTRQPLHHLPLPLVWTLLDSMCVSSSFLVSYSFFSLISGSEVFGSVPGFLISLSFSSLLFPTKRDITCVLPDPLLGSLLFVWHLLISSHVCSRLPLFPELNFAVVHRQPTDVLA